MKKCNILTTIGNLICLMVYSTDHQNFPIFCMVNFGLICSQNYEMLFSKEVVRFQLLDMTIFYYLTIYHRMYKFCYSLVIKKVCLRARDHFSFHFYVLKTLFSLSIYNWFDKYSISVILLKKTKSF